MVGLGASEIGVVQAPGDEGTMVEDRNSVSDGRLQEEVSGDGCVEEYGVEAVKEVEVTETVDDKDDKDE